MRQPWPATQFEHHSPLSLSISVIPRSLQQSVQLPPGPETTDLPLSSHLDDLAPFLVADRSNRQPRLADQVHVRELGLGLDLGERHWARKGLYGLDADRDPVGVLGVRLRPARDP